MTGPAARRPGTRTVWAVVWTAGALVVLAGACRRRASFDAGAPGGARVALERPVGITSRAFDDPTRARRLAVTVWYPAASGTVEETTYWNGIFPGRGAWEAPPRATPARLPLVLLSHGSGGDGSNLAWLAEALAADGWIAAAVDHPGDRFGDWSPEGRFAIWRRAPDLSFALTGLLADATLGPRIDRRRIAAAGHSSGGTTVLLLAGARLRPEDFLAVCLWPDPGPDCGFLGELDIQGIGDLSAGGGTYRDRRVRAVVALAPVFGIAATPASLRAIAVPVQIVASPADELVPLAQNAARYAGRIRGAHLATIPGAGHFAFMPVCTTPGRLVAASVCVDRPGTPDRASVHEQTVTIVQRFLDAPAPRR